MRKLISILLLLLLLGTVPAAMAYYPDIAAEGQGMTCGDGLSWFVDGTVLYISGQGEMYDFPNGAPWAGWKSSLTRVIISDGVTTVGAYAFKDYDALSYVEFGSTMNRIGAEAFYSCDGLTSITLPSTFKKFGESSFRSCRNLKEIHCSGNFPRFDENCLWDTYCIIYFSTANPWSVIYIEQLETAFQGRIEFRASDGTDPYQPTTATQPVYIPEPTQAYTYTEPPLEAPIVITRPTEPVYTEYTYPEYTYPEYTAPVYTAPPQTVPPTQAPVYTEPTQETFLLATQPTRATEPRRGTDGSSIYGVLIIVLTLSIIGTAALLFRIANSPKRRRRRSKKRRK